MEASRYEAELKTLMRVFQPVRALRHALVFRSTGSLTH